MNKQISDCKRGVPTLVTCCIDTFTHNMWSSKLGVSHALEIESSA